MKHLILIMVGLIVLCSGNVLADDKIGIEVTSDFLSEYVWRGQVVNKEPVWQSSYNFSYEKFTASIWGSMDLTNIHGNDSFLSEVDYSLDYSDETGIEGIGYSVGVIYYDFPNTNFKDTTEIYWGLNFASFLNPTVTVYHDVDEAKGSYVSFGLSHSIDKIAEITPELPIGLEIGANLGWGSSSYNKYYWGASQDALNDLTLSVSFPMEIGGWIVAPSLNYMTLVDGDIRLTDAYYADDAFYTGISISKKF